MTFSTTNFFHLSTSPLYTNPVAAFLSRANVFRHYKGGMYSIIGTLMDTEDDEIKIEYEHLWPHVYRRFTRTIPIFFGDATPVEYKYVGPRFWFLRDDGNLIRDIFADVVRPVHVASIIPEGHMMRPIALDLALAYDPPAKTADYENSDAYA